MSCLGQNIALAADVSADLNKTTARVQEELHLSIRIKDAQGSIQAPRIPGIADMDAYYTGRSSRLSLINGRSSSTMEFAYVLVPRKAGAFTVPPIDIQVDSQSFRTEPINVQILESDVSAPQVPARQPYNPTFQRPYSQQPVAPSSTTPTNPGTAAYPNNQNTRQTDVEPSPTDSENIFIVAHTDKSTAYPNEQIQLTYSLYTRYDTRYEMQDAPQVSGFWIEEFPMGENIQKEEVTVKGRRYMKADFKKMALFPTAPAEYTINPGTIKASIRQDPQNSGVFDEFFNDNFFNGANFFSRRQDIILRPKDIPIKVLPFPEQGKPKSFLGSVGNFRLTSSVNKTAVKQDEPVTMTLILEGEGNIETLNKPPIPELENFRTYDGDVNKQLFRNGDRMGGKKTFEVVFIPTKAGQLTIPAMEFSFFNPQSATYQTLKTQSVTLIVTPSDSTFTLPATLNQKENYKKDVEVEKQDIRYISDKWENQKGFSPQWVRSLLGMIDSGLLFFLAFSLIRNRIDESLGKNIALKRRRYARGMAEKRMKKLSGLMKSPEKETQYFEEIEKILTQYLSDKFNFSAQGITRFELELKLQEVFTLGDPLYQDLMRLYSSCDESRFAKARIPKEELIKAYKTLREVIQRVEKIR